MPAVPRISSALRRYFVIGVSVYAFELLVIFIVERCGASNLLAVGLSFWCGLVVSFGLQKLVTFDDRRFHGRIIIPQLLAFALLVLVNFGFTLLITQLLGTFLTVFGARTLALAVTTIWNFYLYKTRIFKPGEPTVY